MDSSTAPCGARSRPEIIAAPPVQPALHPISETIISWHKRTRDLFCYWTSVHPAKGLPGRQHIDPLDIPDLLPGLWLLDVQHDPFRLRYRLVGTAIVQAYGRETTGQWLDESHPQLTSNPRI